MEIAKLLSAQVQAFIEQHKDANPQKLALKAHGKFDFPLGFLIDQISGRQKAKKKLPFLADTNGVLYPPDISIQQCSSEQTASYKASLVAYNSVLDLTGGFGIDSYFFAKKANELVYVERNEWLSNLVQHNFSTLLLDNVHFFNGDAAQFLNTNTTSFDVIYMDPARRSEHGSKVFKFMDCEPNVVALKQQLFDITSHILVKASPMIDISQGIKELGEVKQVWVVSSKNECKEVLFLIEKNYEGQAHLTATEIMVNSVVECHQQGEGEFRFSQPAQYLYDPYVSLHKIGNYSSFLQAFNLAKIAPNTHLFTSNEFIGDFPGRKFEIKQVLDYNKKAVKKALPGMRANVFTRNFFDSPEQLKKKLGINDGGDDFLIGINDADQKALLLWCRLVG